MEKRLLIIGNWKMYKTIAETKKFMQTFMQLYQNKMELIPKTLEFGIAPNFLSLKTLHEKAPLNLILTAQNMSYSNEGALTGETSAQMLKDVEVKMVIIGHSERRTLFHEDNKLINQKILLALENKLTPILCVGETLKEYQANQREEVIKTQLSEGLKNIKDLKKIIIAYEPVWAIGTGKTATPEDAQKMCKLIRELTHEDIIIQYGGSVNENNIKALINQPDINGALVGSASLDPNDFFNLLTLGKNPTK